MLEVAGLKASYGGAAVLRGVDFGVERGEIVALMGRNGMGKTTTINTIFGLVPATEGVVRFQGKVLTGRKPFEIARAGLGLVPEGRRIFPKLSVQENLTSTARQGGDWTYDRVLDLFPRLGERRNNQGNQLSGGEQQMLAIGRALMTNPQMLILDEATEGLAPAIRNEIWACLRGLKETGISILLVDQHVKTAGALANNIVILEQGHVVWQGSSELFRKDETLAKRYLTV